MTDHIADYGLSTKGYTEAVNDVLAMNHHTLRNFLGDMVGPSNVPSTPAQIRLTAAFLVQEEMKHRHANPGTTMMPFTKETISQVLDRARENEEAHVAIYSNDVPVYTPSVPAAPLTAETVESVGTPTPTVGTPVQAPVVAPVQTPVAASPKGQKKRGRKDTGARDIVQAFFNENREALLNKTLKVKDAKAQIAASSHVAENTAMVYLYKCIKDAKGS